MRVFAQTAVQIGQEMPTEIREIPLRLDGLQLAERPRLQSVIWVVQRLVWFLSLGVVLIALMGLTGRGGPWADRTEIGPAAIVDYPRVTRRLASDVLTVRFGQPGENHVLGLSDEFLSRFEVQLITPRPVREETFRGGTALHFLASGPPPHRVTLTLRARESGSLNTQLAVDGTVMPLSLTILP